MKKIYILLAAVLLMVMAGCGGGGDSSSAPSSAKAITEFSLNGIDGTINETEKTIKVTMPPDTTDLTALVATFTITGANVKVGSTDQTSGTTPNDFTGPDPVVYTVTAADATIQNYTVTVSVSLSLSGFPDKDFGTVGTGGKVTTPVGSSADYSLALGIQLDGKIVVAGYSFSGSNYDFALVRYNTDGSLDDGTITDSTPSDQFGIGGKVTTPVGSGDSAAYALTIQLDGKILAAGKSKNGNKNNFTLVRYNLDGSLDTTFDTDGIVTTPVRSFDDIARAISIQSDGKIVVAGYSYYNSSNYDFALVRYNSNGSLDTTFDTDGKVTTPVGSGVYAAAYALAIQLDGKIVAAGISYDDLNSNNDFALVRYNSDGSLDTTFDTDGKVTTPVGTGNDASIAIGIQSDGKIVAAGNSQNGSRSDFALVRYNSNGSLDTTFDTDGKVTTPVGSIENSATALGIQSDDGKIVAAGYSHNDRNYDFALVRYNTDGSLDDGTSTDLTPSDQFGIGGKVTTPVGSSNDVATALGIQSDDKKIVAAGYSYNVSTENYDFALVRYLP